MGFQLKYSRMTGQRVVRFPKTRIATIDIGALGVKKHHVAAFLEADVTDSRAMIRKYRREKGRISFIGWLIKVIGSTIKDYDEAASFLKGKNKLVIFNDVNVSMAVEKLVEGEKVPIPLVVEKVNEKSIEEISLEINQAVAKVLENGEIVVNRKAGKVESIYYILPGFLRRFFFNAFHLIFLH